MRYEKKAAILSLSIICFLLTLASMVLGDPMPETSASGGDPSQSIINADSTPVQGAPVMSTHRDESGETMQAEYQIAPDQIVQTTATPVPVQPVQPAALVENKADSAASTMPTQAPVTPLETPAQTPAVSTIPTQVPASATPYTTPAPQLTPVSSKPIEIGLAQPRPAAPKPMLHEWEAPSEPAPKPARPAAPKKDPGFIAKALAATKGLMNRAVSWLGTRYVWGGISKSGVDCSGLTKLLYQAEGVSLPHLAKLQFQRGMAVARAALLPGDLVFFNTARGPLTHVGIYIGNGEFLHAANPRRGVRVDKLDSGYYIKRFAGARRLKTLG